MQWIAVDRRRRLIPLVSVGSVEFCRPQVSYDLVCSGQRLVSVVTGGSRRRLVSEGGGGLGWRQVAVRDGLPSALDSSDSIGRRTALDISEVGGSLAAGNDGIRCLCQ